MRLFQARTMATAFLALGFAASVAGQAEAACVRNSQGGCMRAMTPPPVIKKKPEPAGCAATPAHCRHK